MLSSYDVECDDDLSGVHRDLMCFKRIQIQEKEERKRKSMRVEKQINEDQVIVGVTC